MGFGLRLFAVSVHENGIGGAVLVVIGVDEWEISRLEVVRTPANGRGVKGDNESRITIFLGPPDDW